MSKLFKNFEDKEKYRISRIKSGHSKSQYLLNKGYFEDMKWILERLKKVGIPFTVLKSLMDHEELIKNKLNLIAEKWNAQLCVQILLLHKIKIPIQKISELLNIDEGGCRENYQRKKRESREITKKNAESL